MRTILLVLALAACETSTTDNFQNPPPGPPATCMTIAALAGCDGGSLAYACSDGRPDDCPGCGAGLEAHQGPNLVCDRGSPGAAGTTLYCCAPYGTYDSDCVATTEIAGCGGTSLGFSCTGETTPAQADAQLSCSGALAGSGGATDFCCTSTPPAPTCAFDASVACTGVAIGFTCAGADAPFSGDASLACTPTGPAGATTSYCCAPPP
ncbi:MAG TPA: hypothetical protein VLX92_19070 [Kofleriaceae bacterium]|nr:hypothetical protein [Kofleriaceae bacterium]